MGYMDITINGSDIAADLHSNVVAEFRKASDKAIKELIKRLPEDHGGFNTPGPVNVAMILTESEEHLPLSLSNDYMKLLEETHRSLKEYIDECKDPEAWDFDDANQDYHLNRYRKLLRKVRRKKNAFALWLDESEHE